MIEPARSGTKVAQLAQTFGMSDATIYIKQLETELAVSRKVNEVFLEGDLPPKGSSR